MIRLASNGAYWQAWWLTSTGRRRSRSLGPKSSMTKSDALEACQRLAIELHIAPGRRDGHVVPCLGEYTQLYLASRTDIRPGTRRLYEQCATLLCRHFTPDLRIDRIDRAAARGWQTVIASRRRNAHRTISESTVRKLVRLAKSIFAQAVADDLLAYNPFDRLASAPLEPDKGSWRYVTLEETDRMIEAAVGPSWKCLIGLARLAGLRVGEALRLRWSDVDFEAHRLTVVAPTSTRTTKHRTRQVPIVPRLMSLLTEGLASAEQGDVLVCQGIKQSQIRHAMHTIIRRAGLTPWPGLLQAMRRNRDTDWASDHPAHVCAAWMGHSEAVARRFYQSVTDEQFDKAIGKRGVSQPPRLPSAR